MLQGKLLVGTVLQYHLDTACQTFRRGLELIVKHTKSGNFQGAKESSVAFVTDRVYAY